MRNVVCLLFATLLLSNALPTPLCAWEKSCKEGHDHDAFVQLVSPKSVDVTLRESVITNTSVPMSKYDPRSLNVDLHLWISCGYDRLQEAGKLHASYSANRITSGGYVHPTPSRPKPRTRTSSGEHTVYDVTYRRVPVAYFTQLYNLCPDPRPGRQYQTTNGKRSPGSGMFDLPIEVTFCCDSGEEQSTLVKKKLTLPVTVLCNDIMRALTRPTLYRHECPQGYVVQGTGERIVEDSSGELPLCVLESQDGKRACPYVYTRTSVDEQWLDQETILTGQDGVSEERTHRRTLTVFSGEVLIREEEPETSYIDYLAVEVTYRDGSRETLAAIPPKLNAIDGKYSVMNEGQVEIVEFAAHGESDCEQVVLISHGYYTKNQP